MPKEIPELVKNILNQKHQLSEVEVKKLIEEEPELAAFLILEQNRLLLELSNNRNGSTPSGMIPVYKKPRVKSSKKVPGRDQGH